MRAEEQPGPNPLESNLLDRSRLGQLLFQLPEQLADALARNIQFFGCRLDAAVLVKSGFTDVRILKENGCEFAGVTLTKTPARHGVIVPCGEACGVVLQVAGEKTLYVAVDTIWYKAVAKTLKAWQPGVIALNACAAETVKNGRQIMGDEDVAAVAKARPTANLLLNHMDNVAHASITRHQMRGYLAARDVKNYMMPEDGEWVLF